MGCPHYAIVYTYRYILGILNVLLRYLKFVCKHQGTVLNGMFDPATTTCEHGQDLCYVFDRDRGGNVCRYTGTYLPNEQELGQTSDTSYDSQPPQVQCDHDRSKCDAGGTPPWLTSRTQGAL